MSEAMAGEAIGAIILLAIIWQAFWHQMSSPASASEVRTIVKDEMRWRLTRDEVRKIVREELENDRKLQREES